MTIIESRSAKGKVRRAGMGSVRRNAAATRQRILDIAMSEFAEHGFSGSRIDRISADAEVNVSMIYHYFGSKDGLYIAALEAAYRKIRAAEQTLDVTALDAVTAMRRLVELTFDFLSTDPHFVRLIMSENLMMGRMVRRSDQIPGMTRPLLDALSTILQRGRREGAFHADVDAAGLYITLLGLCFVHVSNRHTLGSMFGMDLSDPDWLATRRELVADLVVGHLLAAGNPRSPLSSAPPE